MPAESRALRNLCADIVHANAELKRWREDGCATKVQFWLRRRDTLLDRYLELVKEPV